jgi:DNA-binding transcriptional MerR regulator
MVEVMTGPFRDGLLPIDEVGRRLRLRASAIRFYEQRGLLSASRRAAGKRWLDREQVRRLAVIRLWKDKGLLSLGQIAEFVSTPTDSVTWARAVDARIEELTREIDRLDEAREFLRHVRHHHQGDTPDGCPHYEDLLGSDLRT